MTREREEQNPGEFWPGERQRDRLETADGPFAGTQQRTRLRSRDHAHGVVDKKQGEGVVIERQNADPSASMAPFYPWCPQGNCKDNNHDDMGTVPAVPSPQRRDNGRGTDPAVLPPQ